jgi:hypothetical protein
MWHTSSIGAHDDVRKQLHSSSLNAEIHFTLTNHGEGVADSEAEDFNLSIGTSSRIA